MVDNMVHILNLVMDVNVENLDHAPCSWSITSQHFWILYVEKTPQGKSIISNRVPLVGS